MHPRSQYLGKMQSQSVKSPETCEFRLSRVVWWMRASRKVVLLSPITTLSEKNCIKFIQLHVIVKARCGGKLRKLETGRKSLKFVQMSSIFKLVHFGCDSSFRPTNSLNLNSIQKCRASSSIHSFHPSAVWNEDHTLPPLT